MNLVELSNCATAKRNPRLIPQITSFLQRDDVEDTKGSQRIAVVCENFKFLTFEEAYRLIDPDAFQDEFEEIQLHKRWVKTLNYVRVILSLAPLILTWYALFLATSGYQADLKNYSTDQGVTFLQLWQNGFHNTTPFTFSATALIDVGLLSALLASTVFSLWLEHRARQTSKRFAKDLQDVAAGLLNVVNNEGVNPLTSDADIDKVVNALRVALGGVFDTTEEAIRKAMEVVVKANDRVEQLFTHQIQPLFSTFDRGVSSFHQDVTLLTQEVRQLSTASTTMVTASRDMAGSASNMAASASVLQASVHQIDAHLVSLNQTEGEMVTKIELAQQGVANQVKKAAISMELAAGNVASAAGRMDQAAQQVEKVGLSLTSLNSQNVKQMHKDATTFTDKAKETALELQKTIDAVAKFNGRATPRPTRKLFGVIPI